MVFVFLGSCCITEQTNEALVLVGCPVLFGFTAEGVVHLCHSPVTSHLGSSVRPRRLHPGPGWRLPGRQCFQRGLSYEEAAATAEPVCVQLLPASTSPPRGLCLWKPLTIPFFPQVILFQY